MQNININKNRNANIDSLKGIAIIAVVFYHIGLLPFGYLGVDLFLVINGYFITKELTRRYENGRVEYFKFLADRLFRLWPLTIALGGVCLIVGYFNMLPDDYENVAQSVFASNFFANNILSCITTGNYWSNSNTFKPLMHMWYLGILFQCYVIYPLFFLLALKIKSNKSPKWIMITACILSLFLFLIPNITDAQRFYYLPFRFFEIASGGLLYLLFKGKKININNQREIKG